MAKVSNTMATEIKLDTVSAASSLKTLNNAIKGTTSAWKANEVSLKSAGDYLKAAEAKYKGIGETISVVQDKVTKLREKQASLDTSTKDGAEQYSKLSTQLAQTENKLASLTSQQSRAKSSMEYYKSGLGDLQKSFKSVNAVTNSYVERLQAEGKEAESQKAKLGGLRDSVANLGKQYKVQSDELSRIKRESGEASDAYKQQEIRLNKTATSMAKLKTSQNELVKAMEKEPHGFMSGVRSKLDGIDAKAKKTSHLFGTILGAHLVANGITNVIGQISASFGTLKDSVVAYDNKQRTMTATWDTLTGSNGKGKQMVGIGNKLASAFNQNINVVDELNQSFYHVFDNAPRTKELTKSILTLGDTLNLSDENVTRLGTNFTHMLSSGKMQLGDFNMINDQLPMYAGKMLEFERKQQHNSKLTMSTLREQMSAGKISAKDAEEVMNSLGGKYAKASENLMKTIPGMERSIKTQMPALLDAVYKPIANMKSPLMGQFTKWIGDKNTKSKFKDVGNALALQINNITKAFTGKKFNVGDSLNKMLANLAKGIDKVGANIVAHKKEIKSFFGSMKTASKTSFNVFVQSLKDIEPILKIIGEFAEKHPKVFAGLASSAYVASKGISALKLAFSGLDLAKGLGGKLSRIVFKPKVDGAEGKRELTKFASFVKRSGTRMGHWLKMTASVTTTKAKGALSSLWTHTKSVGGKIGKGLKWTAKIAYKGASKAFRVLVAGIKILGKSFLSLSRLLLLNPIGLVITAVVALGAAFYEAYKHIKPFRTWVNKTVKSVVRLGKSIGKWAGHIGKSVKNGIHAIGRNWNKFRSSFKKSWNKHWSSVGRSLKHSWNTSVHNTKSFFGSMGSHFNSFRKSFSHSWTNHWDNMRSKLHSYWNKDLKHTRVFGHSMGDWLWAFKKSFKNGWTNLVSGVKSIFTGLWKDLKGLAKNGMNDMINIINSGINLVDGVIHTFGGKKKAIGDIGHVHFATGTGIFSGNRKAITKPTMAVLNDGNDSPETGNKEAVFLPNGQSGIVQGRNTQAMLPAGTEVLNASETKLFMGMQGITHFAKGSSNWFGNIMSGIGSGIGDISGWLVKKATGLKKFFTTAEKIIAHPIKSLNSMFNYTKAGAGVVADITKGLFNNVKKQAGNWWSSLWSMVDLDGGSAGGNWRHNPGLSETNGFGASRSFGSHDGVDFSGPLGSAILAVHGGTVTHVGRPLHGWPYSQLGDVITVASNDGWQEIYQEFGGMNNVKVGTGDVIKTGQRIATLGRLNGAGSGSHVHIGVSHGSLWDHGGSSTKGWYDVTKMHGKSDGSPKSSKQSGNIKGIKSQVGSGFFKFMAKLANMFGDNEAGNYGNPAGGGVSRWRKYVVKALKANGFSASPSQISAWMRVIARESNGDPKAINTWDSNARAGHPSKGLVQTIQPTFNANAFKGHHDIFNGYDDLLAGIRYMSRVYGRGSGAFARVASRGYANGGISRFEKLAHISEGNKTESIVPWDITKRARAYQIMDSTMKEFAKTDKPRQSTTQSTQSTDLSELIKQGKEIIGLMAELISGQQNPVPAVVSDNAIYNGYNRMSTKTKLSKNLGRGYTNGIQ